MAIQKFTVSRDESIYEAWPDVILTDSGKLISVFAECEHHLDRRNARIAIVESTDRGRTWSAKKYLTERAKDGIYYNCPRISKLRDGTLAIICDRIYKDERELADISIWRADAEGTEWTKFADLDFCAIVPDKLLELESGRLIISAHFGSEEHGKLTQYLWYSDDKGKTWSERVTVATDPRYNLCETSILNCGGGKLVAFLRENSGLGYPIFKVISYDGGETWSEIYETPIDSGHRPVSAFLADGTVMVTYRYIPRGTQNVFSAFLKSGELEVKERKRQSVRIMPLDYDRNPSPDLGYTGWVQFDDGEIYVVNYIKDDADKAFIRGYSFYPSDVLLPKNDNTTKSVFGD